MALCVDEFFQNFLELETQSNYDWYELEELVLASTHEVFLFRHYSFYFNMMKNVIEDLIPTGIMKYLVENFYTKKFRFEKVQAAGPAVLTFDDLLFGFKIWVGSFLLALLAFFAENFARLKKKKRKMKFDKVHPLEETLEETPTILTLDQIGMFRKVQNLNQVVASERLITSIKRMSIDCIEIDEICL
jgi:hypothetical protein